MRGILSFAGNLFWVLAGTALILIVLYFVVKFTRRHAPSPISNLAGAVEGALQP